jgi:hypothetical protein
MRQMLLRRSGGAERQQWLLARVLAAAGWQVVVGVQDALPFNERTIIQKVEFVGIGGKHFLWSWYSFIMSQKPDWLYWRFLVHRCRSTPAVVTIRCRRDAYVDPVSGQPPR